MDLGPSLLTVPIQNGTMGILLPVGTCVAEDRIMICFLSAEAELAFREWLGLQYETLVHERFE